MKKSVLKITAFSLLVAALALSSGQALGQETKKEGKGKKAAAVAEGEKAAKKQGVIPFRGKIGAVDKSAKTITVGERTFTVADDTRIMKAGKKAELGEAAVGEEVGGSYKKTDDGKLVLQMLRIGPKPEGTAEGKGEAKKEGGKKKKNP